MRDAIEKIFNWLVMADIYASLIAAGIVPITIAVLGLPLDVLSMLMVFFPALFVYTLNRQSDQDIDALNVPARTKFVVQNGWIVLVFATGGFFSLLTYAFMTNFQVFLLFAIVFILGLFYSFPILYPLRNILGFERFKDRLGVKNALISAMYGGAVLVPVVNAHAAITHVVLLLFFFIFIRLFIISVLFDFRDVKGDAIKNINTIPIVFGKEKTFLFLHALNILTLVIFAIIAFYHVVSALFGAMVLITFLFSLYYLLESEKENADLHHLCGVMIEADFLPAIIIAIPFLLKAFI